MKKKEVDIGEKGTEVCYNTACTISVVSTVTFAVQPVIQVASLAPGSHPVNISTTVVLNPVVGEREATLGTPRVVWKEIQS